MSITPPVFNLTASNIGFNDASLEAELNKSTGTFFDAPGNFDLVICGAEFHQNKDTGSIYCKGDESWVNVKVTLKSVDDRTIDHWLQVPTNSILYGEKKTLAVYRNFQQFVHGIGESSTIDGLQKLLQKYFANPAKLIGQKVNVDLGFKGPHVSQTDQGFVVIAKNKPLQEDGVDVVLPDRGSAVQYAKAMNVEPGFIKVLKFTARKQSKVKVAANDWE